MAPTISDVAKLAGVGTTTVTKVLAGRKYVSEPTRKRIHEAIAALDYHPSTAGRVLRTGVAHVLGVITPPPLAQPFTHYAFFSRVLDGIGECAAAHGYDVLWITGDRLHASGGGEPGSYAALFKSKRVDGLIDLYIHPHDPRIDGMRASGYPFVLVGNPEDESLPHVFGDHRQGGALAGQAFIRRGHTSVGYIGIEDSPASRGRFGGLCTALAEVGQVVLPEHIGLAQRRGKLPDYERLGWSTMRRWLAGKCAPRAVLTFSDSIAYGVLRACHESGIGVPDELAIVGFDDEPPSRLITPPLATVQQPFRELGHAAASLLLQILAGATPDPPREIVPMSLIERESLGPISA